MTNEHGSGVCSSGRAPHLENREIRGTPVTYTYDGDGNRVKKSNGPLYWGSGPLAESDLSGTIQREYIFFNGKRVARRDVPGTPSVHFYFSDHLGSASVVTNASGTMSQCPAGNSPLNYTSIATGEEESDYYPYGGEMKLCDRAAQNYKFTGKERDTESGLDNFGARYDASSLGRFMIPDWAAKATDVPYADFGDPQTLNLYGYVRNNPLAGTDRDGHDFIDVTRLLHALDNVTKNPYVQGGTQVVVGVGLILTTAAGDAPGGAAGALMVAGAVMGGTATAVNGTAQIVGTATKTDTSEARETLSATSSLPGLVTAAGTGAATGEVNLKAAAAVTTLTNAATLATAPKEAFKNAATAADAAQTVKDTGGLIRDAAKTVKKRISSQPPAPPKPHPPSECLKVGPGACTQ